jgi:hypothetical protein
LYDRYYHGTVYGKSGIAGIKKGVQPRVTGKEVKGSERAWKILHTHNVNVTGLPDGVNTQQVGDIFQQFMNQKTSDAVIAGAMSHY